VVALLRGVNVGGRTLSMAALREALAAEGCGDVVTYIQSGNAVLTLPPRAPRDPTSWIEAVVADVAGYDVPVVLRTPAELRRVVAANPYPHAAAKELHVVFFARAPARPFLAALDVESFAPERATLSGRELYLHLPNGMGRAKLPPALEQAGSKLRPPATGTARSWNTVGRLVELAG
jgi:uncharacterized protein (DUF1697 family)